MKGELTFTSMSCVHNRVVTVIMLLCVVQQVIADDTEIQNIVEQLPATEEQISELSRDVCDMYFYNETEEDSNKVKNCQYTFTSLKRSLPMTPTQLNIICRSKNRVIFSITPISHWRIVALVPEDQDSSIGLSLMNVSQESDTIRVDNDDGNYTFWTAIVNDDGTPGMWIRGPRLPSWDGQEKLDVFVDEPHFQYNGHNKLNAIFKISFFGELSPCTRIEVTNMCDKSDPYGDDFFETVISLMSVHKSRKSYKKINNRRIVQKLVVDKVPLKDNCTLTLWKDGTTLLEKRFATSLPIQDVMQRQKLKQDNIQIRGSLSTAVEDLKLLSEVTMSGWQIKVKWSPPKHKPEEYNVTLRTDTLTQTIQALGNATSVVFNVNVTEEYSALYNVTVISITSRGHMKTTQWGQFPEPEIPKDVSIEAEPTLIGWDVHVKWTAPNNNPSKYNLTLRAPGVKRTICIPGTATSFTFKDVLGEEMALYNVSVVAISPRGKASTSRRALLTERSNYQAVIMTSSWSIAMTLAAAVFGAIMWWRRRKPGFKPIYIDTPDIKLPEECMIETCSESGVEDGWELRSDRLVLHEVIGEGAFGVVRRGTLAPGNREVAVKMLREFPTLEEIRSFLAEMELMKSVGAHPHVVSLVGCCSGRRPLIVSEYCSRGDLLNFLRCSWDVMVSKRNAKYYNNNIESSDYRNDLFKKPQKDSKCAPLVVNKLYDLQGICDSELTPLDLLSFCRQIAMGMQFLASNRVVHRDLAARNILVTADRTLKIADFGLSRDVYQENQYKQKGNGKLPVKWMALESLTHRIYTTQSDVWSFGVVVWEVVTVGGAPYAGVPPARLPRLLKGNYRMPRPNNCSKQLYDVMLSCWRARPRDRPTFAELHERLDELLNSACANEYLSLELDDDAPPTPKPQRYIKMILRGNRVWTRGESYERPLKRPQTNNYYTAAPAIIPKQLV